MRHQIKAETTALILIDLQKGILGQKLSPYSRGDIISRCASLATTVQGNNGTLVLIHVGFSTDYADKLNQNVDQPMHLPPEGLPADWSDFVSEIEALKPDIVIKKRQWGAFYATELDMQLRRRGIETIILGGVATNFGVEQTAREAYQHNYAVIVAEDACTSVSADFHTFSIKNIMPRIARVMTTDDLIRSLEL